MYEIAWTEFFAIVVGLAGLWFLAWCFSERRKRKRYREDRELFRAERVRDQLADGEPLWRTEEELDRKENETN